MEDAVFKRLTSLFWPERVRKLVISVLENRPSAVMEAVLAHGPERPTKRAEPRIPDGQRAVSRPVLGVPFVRSQGRSKNIWQTHSKPVGYLFPKLDPVRFGSRFSTGQNGRQNGLGPVLKTGRGPFWDPSRKF
jgi:hypothetical protein